MNHNPLAHLTPYVRAVIYIAAVVTGALVAGFTALGELPDWLVFTAAVVASLTGGTALSNLDPEM